jgi:hypothetical protein
MTMERSQPESQRGSSRSRSSSPESKQDNLLNVNAPPPQALASTVAANQPSFAVSLADRIRNASLRQDALHQMILSGPQGMPVAAQPANIGNALQAVLNNQQLISDSLRFGRTTGNLSFQLMLAGQQNPLANASNPYAASLLQGSGGMNASERALQHLLLGAHAQAQARSSVGSAATQFQRELTNQASSQSAHLQSLNEREQNQLLLMQLNSSRQGQAAGLSFANTAFANAPRISNADLLRLSTMGALNNSGQGANSGDMLRGSLLPRSGASSSLGLLAQREQQLSQLVADPPTPSPGSNPSLQVTEATFSVPGAAQSKAERKEDDDDEEEKASVPDASANRKRKAPPNPGSPKPQRRRRSRDPVVIQGVPHHTEREYLSLGIEEDPNWLSEFQCFVRSELMEVIQASQSDVLVRSTSKSILPDQVGVRCRYW